MGNRVNEAFYEQVSAYLDGELSGKDAAALENLLNADKEARLAAEELRQTRTLLRAVALRPVPHHFTLTRQMAAEMQRKRGFFASPWPARLAGLVAAFLLVFAGSLGILLPPPVTTAPAPEAALPVLMVADEAAQNAEPVSGYEMTWLSPPGSAPVSPVKNLARLSVSDNGNPYPVLMKERTDLAIDSPAALTGPQTMAVMAGAGGMGGIGGMGGGFSEMGGRQAAITQPFSLPANAVPVEALPMAVVREVPADRYLDTYDNGPILGVPANPGAVGYATDLTQVGGTGPWEGETYSPPVEGILRTTFLLVRGVLAGLGVMFAGLAVFLALRKR